MTDQFSRVFIPNDGVSAVQDLLRAESQEGTSNARKLVPICLTALLPCPLEAGSEVTDSLPSGSDTLGWMEVSQSRFEGAVMTPFFRQSGPDGVVHAQLQFIQFGEGCLQAVLWIGKATHGHFQPVALETNLLGQRHLQAPPSPFYLRIEIVNPGNDQRGSSRGCWGPYISDKV